MDQDSSEVVTFNCGSLLQGQMWVAKLKSAYNSLMIAHRFLCVKPTYRKSCTDNLLIWSDLALPPPVI